MNERERAALEALYKAPKYSALSEETLRRVFERALLAHRNVKAADKAARAALHQMSAMYFSERERREAHALLSSGDFSRDALFALFRCHASTRERIDEMDALYDRVFSSIGAAVDVVDYACGLNPLYLGMRGVRAAGLDIHKDVVDLVNRWAGGAGYPVSAEVKDLLSMDVFPQGELALAMKILPVLERERRGFTEAFLRRVPCRYLLATFPRRTLGGRGGFMDAHYEAWFLERLPERLIVIDRFFMENESCYLLEAQNV